MGEFDVSSVRHAIESFGLTKEQLAQAHLATAQQTAITGHLTLADRREARVTIKPTVLGDERYESQPLLVKILAVVATRDHNGPWDIEHIDVYGQILTESGTEVRASRRSYYRRPGHTYGLEDAPGWVREIAREALACVR